MNSETFDEQRRRIAFLLDSRQDEDGLAIGFSPAVGSRRGVQPSCPLFSDDVAQYFENCLPESFELFMLFYDTHFPFSKVTRGFGENFGLLSEIVDSGVIR